MSVTWYLVQYMDRPERREPRNVGLLVEGPDQHRVVRFLAERPDGQIDQRRVRSIGDRDAYKRWLRYLRWSFLENGQEISALVGGSPGDHIIVTPGGRQLYAAGGLDLQTTADQLYQELVVRPVDTTGEPVATVGHPDFEQRAHLLLRAAHLIGSESWRPELRVELQVAARTAFTFPGAWVNGHTTVAYHLTRADEDRLAAAELRIGAIPDNFGAVVLCPDSVGEAAMQHLERLAYVASVDSTPAAEIRAMFEEPPVAKVRLRETVTNP